MQTLSSVSGPSFNLPSGSRAQEPLLLSNPNVPRDTLVSAGITPVQNVEDKSCAYHCKKCLRRALLCPLKSILWLLGKLFSWIGNTLIDASQNDQPPIT